MYELIAKDVDVDWRKVEIWAVRTFLYDNIVINSVNM